VRTTRRARHDRFRGEVCLSRRAIVGIFVAALVLRLAAVTVLGPRLGTDSVEYVAWGRALASGGPSALSVLRAEHAPLYGVFLAIGVLLTGMDLAWFAVLSQCLVGALTAVILARLTARATSNPRAGLFAGAAAAVHVSFVFWTAYLLSDTLFLLFVALCVERGLALGAPTSTPLGLASRRGLALASRAALVSGLALVSVAARPTGVALCAALVPLMLVTARGSARRLVLLCGGYCLPFLAVTIVSLVAVVLGSTATVSGLSSVTAWTRSGIENGLLWTETGRATAGIDVDVYPPPVLATLPPEQRDEFLQARPLDFASRHPEFVISQVARKFRTFWAPTLPEYSLPHALTSATYFLVFYAMALLGLYQARRYAPLLTIVIAGALAFTLASLITIVDYDLRYRLPAELFLIPVVGLGLSSVFDRLLLRGAALVKLAGYTCLP
jgi:hypothetical protein